MINFLLTLCLKRGHLKYIYHEKVTKFCEFSTVDLSYVVTGQMYGGDFAKFCGLHRIYELYSPQTIEDALKKEKQR